jgi:hypothetical protein
MILPVLTAIVIIFIIWINYEIHKTTKLHDNDTEKFWNREKESNQKPKMNISSLDYIIVSTERLPINDTTDQTADSYRDTIQALSGKKALNLSEYTNTELKNLYGAANIKLLSEYDNNYTSLVSVLQKWAGRLHSLGLSEKARDVLTYAVACHTDVTMSYLLLANLYRMENEMNQIEFLLNEVLESKIPDKENLIHKLTLIMHS